MTFAVALRLAHWLRDKASGSILKWQLSEAHSTPNHIELDTDLLGPAGARPRGTM